MAAGSKLLDFSSLLYVHDDMCYSFAEGGKNETS